MGWATPYIAKLKAGGTVHFRPRGHSMKGQIESGQLCTVARVDLIKAIQGPAIADRQHLRQDDRDVDLRCIEVEP